MIFGVKSETPLEPNPGCPFTKPFRDNAFFPPLFFAEKANGFLSHGRGPDLTPFVRQ